MNTYILVIHALVCAFMTGLIWLIQLVHYPSFQFVNKQNFLEFHSFHSTRITWIVGPMMLLELITAAYLLMTAEAKGILILNLVLLIMIWLSTAFLSVPLHNQLASGFNSEIIQKLVVTNWPRTVLWTLRFGLLIYLILLGDHLSR